MIGDKIMWVKYDSIREVVLSMIMKTPPVGDELDFIKLHGFFPTDVYDDIIECYVYDVDKAAEKMRGGVGIQRAIRDAKLKKVI